MKEWIVIHQIKALHNKGNGLSARKIAKQLGLSRNTVSKYLNQSEPNIAADLSDTDRTKKLDTYRDYIIQLLQTYSGLSVVKVMRKLQAKVETLSVSDRSVRRYIQAVTHLRSFFIYKSLIYCYHQIFTLKTLLKSIVFFCSLQ